MSKHSEIVKECDELVRKILRHIYGTTTCVLCGARRPDLGVMHILGKKAHPELRWDLNNVVLAGWGCCHQPYDHDPKRRPCIERLIEKHFSNYKNALNERKCNALKKLYMPAVKENLERMYSIMVGGNG